MYSKVKLAGRPVHPMLVSFPVAFYAATAVCYAVYASRLDPFWFRVGWLANAAGVICALVAALPGFVDWAAGIPRGTPAKRTGAAHMLCNVAALALFAFALWTTRDQFPAAAPVLGAALGLSIAGLALALVAGLLDWKMVRTHHVGVELTPEQERREPKPTHTPSESGRTIGGPVPRH